MTGISLEADGITGFELLELKSLLNRWFKLMPSLKAINPHALLASVGLLHSDGPPFRGTKLLGVVVGEDKLDEAVGGLNLLQWLNLWEMHRSDKARVACSMWSHLGRFPSAPFTKEDSWARRPPFAHASWNERPFMPPKWVIEKYEKTPRQPDLARLLQIFGGPDLWPPDQVLAWFQKQNHLRSLDLSNPTRWESLLEENRKTSEQLQERLRRRAEELAAAVRMGAKKKAGSQNQYNLDPELLRKIEEIKLK